MALGFTQPLTEMSTRNITGGKAWSASNVDNLTAIREPTVQKMWDRLHLFYPCGVHLEIYRQCNCISPEDGPKGPKHVVN
jgi:hypothetical protein